MQFAPPTAVIIYCYIIANTGIAVGYDVSRRSQGAMSSLPFATALAQHFTAAAL
jgi:hypothetical protein